MIKVAHYNWSRRTKLTARSSPTWADRTDSQRSVQRVVVGMEPISTIRDLCKTSPAEDPGTPW